MDNCRVRRAICNSPAHACLLPYLFRRSISGELPSHASPQSLPSVRCSCTIVAKNLASARHLFCLRGSQARRLPQVSRPVTRNFFAQLLANAQSTTIENCKVNGGAIVADGALPENRG
ncbi:hypothetical protein BUALT_Bualt11G0017700 [Buddleja alternifolia]|uniref:Uncharacterized protein n=1 Tax=Buddleja alternifolia TaxID=168488 RepID=A0AAV6X2F6_9LAMI|nr:hypothetical protein BUALT_Bualt11G0017700 [Buddleja alternifolia]